MTWQTLHYESVARATDAGIWFAGSEPLQCEGSGANTTLMMKWGEMIGMGATETLQQRLLETGQAHLWNLLLTLPQDQQTAFHAQLTEIDWGLIRTLWQSQASGDHDAAAQVKAAASRAQPPEHLVRQPANAADREAWQKAREVGLQMLRDGKVAAVVVAGGQGTRLGFDQPKGMFPIGPVSGHSLFQIFCEQINARGRQAGRAVPYGIMTSDATHAATVAYFYEHQRFDLLASHVSFFQQASLPAVDAGTGQALLSGAGQLALSPDGHGGMLRALLSSGLLDQWQSEGIETVFYHQVDNPTTQVCDPAFLGFHALHQAEVSTKVVAKRDAAEKMGVAVSVDGVSQIIEYSDLPPEVATKTDKRGRLLLWAGNTAIHAFQLEFLRRMATDGQAFPFHIARKAVPYVNADGQLVTPVQPNAFKFEQFIFDLLPAAKTSLIVEANRAAEFNPVKNQEGADSPETCRAALQTMHRQWVRAAGAKIGENVPIEISPLYALDAEQVGRRLGAGEEFTSAIFLN